MIDVLTPAWTAPDNVVAFTTTRIGGVSVGQWQGLNLGAHVGDNIDHVAQNRQRLQRSQRLPTAPRWLNQVHGVDVLRFEDDSDKARADAVVAEKKNQVCAVLTADCLPVFLCDVQGTAVAVAHAGWRGLAAGVLEASVDAFPAPAQDILAAFGPAIGIDAYEVGAEVLRELNIDKEIDATIDASSKTNADGMDQSIGRSVCRASATAGHAYISLTALATQRLDAMGVTVADTGSPCTHADSTLWYSHRRDGATGRMASVIYLC